MRERRNQGDSRKRSSAERGTGRKQGGFNPKNNNNRKPGGSRAGFSDRNGRPERSESGDSESRSGFKREQGGYRSKNNNNRRPGSSRTGFSGRSERPERSESGDFESKSDFRRDKGGFRSKDNNRRPGNSRPGYAGRSRRSESGEFDSKPDFKRDRKSGERSNFRKGRPDGRQGEYKRNAQESQQPQQPKQQQPKAPKADSDHIRLNKYVANAGICSRREADTYITTGLVEVDGKIITEMGYKVAPGSVVKFNGEAIKSEKKVYLLLNKPKDCVTTADDPFARRTVLDLTKNACKERVYPVGRLDRNTLGVLLLTNDGEMARMLTHPKFKKKKIYHVFLDNPLRREDYEKIEQGFTLDDGFIKADKLSYVEGKRTEIGIELHSGRNRIVRRIFEHFGYKVEKLDRVYFAGLTKKDLPRGKWRFLTDTEIAMLKMGSYE